MIEISCFYVHHYNRDPINFTFIKYDKFIKIILQMRKIIIEIKNLKNYKTLFQFYILSLLCTKNTSKISKISDYDSDDENELNKNYVKYYGVSTLKYWKSLHFTYNYETILLEKNCLKNPLFSEEPKRETSFKKQKKLLKLFSNYYKKCHINEPLYYINDYQNEIINDLNMKKIIQYEKKIYLLCCIRGFNRDIYTNIKKFMN